jgi:hypothetical protein
LAPEFEYLHVDLPITISEILMRTTTGAPILQDIMCSDNINLLFEVLLCFHFRFFPKFDIVVCFDERVFFFVYSSYASDSRLSLTV